MRSFTSLACSTKGSGTVALKATTILELRGGAAHWGHGMLFGWVSKLCCM
jgi:hypothetical protein